MYMKTSIQYPSIFPAQVHNPLEVYWSIIDMRMDQMQQTQSAHLWKQRLRIVIVTS